MMTICSTLARLSDGELVAEVKRLAARECQATAHLVASLAELDARRVYLGQGYSSLFTYCTGALGLSEHAAYNRIEAARAARRCPLILERLADGAITLTAVGLLAAHLTEDNHRGLLDEARGRSKREIERIVARLQPRPDVRSSVRKLPDPKPAARVDRLEAGQAVISPTDHGADRPVATSPSATVSAIPPVRLSVTRPAVTPLAPERYKVQMAVSAETHAKLRRVQDLMRHSIPDGDPAAIFDRALTVLLEHLERTRLAALKRPRPARSTSPRPSPSRTAPTPNTAGGSVLDPSGAAAPLLPCAHTRASMNGSRHIPAAVKRAVWVRDQAQCTFVGTEGRCCERGLLEYHHRVPYAAGGQATVGNITLMCKLHNAHQAEQAFGPWRPAAVKSRRTAREGPTRSGTSC